jgi:hypothetical protein
VSAATEVRTTCRGCGEPIDPGTNNRKREWCSDRCRKRTLYSRQCVDCGATCNVDGRVEGASERCGGCSRRYRHEARRWTPEAVIAAIQAWADEHGGVPPVATDWNATVARASGRGARGDEFPSLDSVQAAFGTWSAAITAAGFVPFTSGLYGREGEDPAILAETARLYRSGLSLAEVGERMGVTGTTVGRRLMKVGEPRRRCGRYPSTSGSSSHAETESAKRSPNPRRHP